MFKIITIDIFKISIGVDNNLFVQLYVIKYFYSVQLICNQLYGFTYSNLI